MKHWLRFLIGVSLLLGARAQQPSIITVSMTEIAVTGGTTFKNGTQNESYGPVGSTITMSALAVGTFPASGYTYTFFLDGVALGSPAVAPPAADPGAIAWKPSRPGSYFLTVKAVGGSHEATSLPIRYFAVGTMITSPTNNTIVPNGSSVAIQATAMAQPLQSGTKNAFIQRIDFYADGVKIGEDVTAPYSTVYTPNPALPSPHRVEARAFDNNGNQVSLDNTAVVTLTSVPPIGTPPVVSISSPANGAKIALPSGGTGISVAVSAGSEIGRINKVELYIDGTLHGTSTTFPYSFAWTPTVIGEYRLVALAYDDKNNVVASTTSSVAGSSPAPTLVKIAAPPSVSLNTPAAGAAVGSPTVLSATATDSNVIGGGIAKVQFYANQVFIGEATSPTSANQFSYSWTPLVATVGEPMRITAVAINNLGLSTTSAVVPVSVSGGGGGIPAPVGASPTVSVTSPAASSQLVVNREVTLTASASDADGNIESVEFFQNDDSLGISSSYPYLQKWTPTSLGRYVLTAKALDNRGNATTSATITVNVTAGNSERVYTGSFSGLGETGRFALLISGQSATFIGHSNAGSPKAYFYPALSVDSVGGFSLADSTGRVTIAGSAGDTGVTITRLGGESTLLIGTIISNSDSTVRSGLYSGSLAGSLGSQVTAIVGEDRSIMLYAADGSARTAGSGSISATGDVAAISTTSGGVFSGKIDLDSRFLTGTLSGAGGGSVVAGLASGLTFSDGFMRNLSTRGRVGLGVDALTAGFYVGGTTSKQVLIRAIGPSLANYQITGPVADPTLTVYNSSGAVIATNTNWAGASAIAAAGGAVGAFPLSADSLDAVVLTTLAPGAYSAQVTVGTGSAGVGLVEIYDVDTLAAYSEQKVINLSTRGWVGPGQDQLNAGFMVSGTTPKKVLIRAAGPGLGEILKTLDASLAGRAVADPVLRLVRLMPNGSQVAVRENDSWEVGNDAALVSAAAAKSGAFPFTAGSKDAALLVTIPPGTYFAVVSAPGTATGLALVEVYEVP